MLRKDDVVDEAYEPTEREPRTAIFLFLRMSPGICEVAGRGRREEGREGRARGGGCSSGGYKLSVSSVMVIGSTDFNSNYWARARASTPPAYSNSAFPQQRSLLSLHPPVSPYPPAFLHTHKIVYSIPAPSTPPATTPRSGLAGLHPPLHPIWPDAHKYVLDTIILFTGISAHETPLLHLITRHITPTDDAPTFLNRSLTSVI